jgi:predicted RNA-binding Zn-ribbon protein involved in translation (DUF1610 family)
MTTQPEISDEEIELMDEDATEPHHCSPPLARRGHGFHDGLFFVCPNCGTYYVWFASRIRGEWRRVVK